MLLHEQAGYGSNTTIHLAARDPVEGTSDTAGSLAPGSRQPAGSPGNRHTPRGEVVAPASRGGAAGAVASGAMGDRTTPSGPTAAAATAAATAATAATAAGTSAGTPPARRSAVYHAANPNTGRYGCRSQNAAHLRGFAPIIE